VALIFTADAFEGEIATILDTFKAHDAHVTFFLTGHYLERYPEEVRAIDSAGEEIASHGYYHYDFRDMSNEEIIGQLGKWRQTFQGLTGKTGPRVWMAPYGYTNSRVRQVAAAQGYTTMLWTLDTLDSVGEPKSKAYVLDRVLGTSINLDGAIVLMHVDKKGTIAALPEILDGLGERGFRVVTVSELLRRQ
jgi:peptidoglycan/xylan/chitin deacetylase (PgdA/CDA1 family)